MTLFKGDRRIKKMTRDGTNARFLMHKGRQVWPCLKAYREVSLDFRTVEEDGEKWFEVGFRSPEQLVGNAAAGWHDDRGYCQLDIEQSEDLVSWNLGKMIDCATTEIDNGDGTWDYWARCIYPIDSEIKTN